MSTFLGVRKVKGGEWTPEEKKQYLEIWRKQEKKLINKRRAEGFDLNTFCVEFFLYSLQICLKMFNQLVL